MAGAILVSPGRTFVDESGNPLAAGHVDVYLAGTTSRANTWQDKNLSVLNTNPIVLDANGACEIWGNSALTYKWVISKRVSDGVYAEVDTIDNISPANNNLTPVPIVTVDTFDGTGTTSAYTLSVTPATENETEVFVAGVYQNKSTYSLSGNQLTGNFTAGSDNVEVVTTSVADMDAVAEDLAAFADAASASASAAATSATSAATSATAALGYKDAAAAILALIGAGGTGLERQESFDTTVNQWTVAGSPFASVTKVFIDGRLQRLNNFTLSNGGRTVTANFTLQSTKSLVDIFYI